MCSLGDVAYDRGRYDLCHPGGVSVHASVHAGMPHLPIARCGPGVLCIRALMESILIPPTLSSLHARLVHFLCSTFVRTRVSSSTEASPSLSHARRAQRWAYFIASASEH